MINITNQEDCTGCYACLNVCPQNCISMNNDNEGFKYPKVDIDICVNCGLCEKVCPIIHTKIVKNEPMAFACMNNNYTIRLKSSSGGIFTSIAEHIINKGGIVFGAGFNEEFKLVHNSVKTLDELNILRGSKYVQSEINDTYSEAEQLLKQGKIVLFSGTPCQISGLKSFLQCNYDNLLCIDIICHGVPSPKVWQKYITFREKLAGSKTSKVNFRNKVKGWRNFSVSFNFNNGSEYIQTLDLDLYMKTFLQNISLRPSCYACNFKTLNRESDITLADFWGIQNVVSEMDDDKGTSLIFINSPYGKNIFKEIKDNIVLKEVDIHKAVSYNSAAIKSVAHNPTRKMFFRDINKLDFDKLVTKYCLDSILEKIIRKLRSLIKIFVK